MHRSVSFGLAVAVLAVGGGAATFLSGDTSRADTASLLLASPAEVGGATLPMVVRKQSLLDPMVLETPAKLECPPGDSACRACTAASEQLDAALAENAQLELTNSQLHEEIAELWDTLRGNKVSAEIRAMLRTEFADLYVATSERNRHIDRLVDVLERVAEYTEADGVEALRHHISSGKIRQLAEQLPALRAAMYASPGTKSSYTQDLSTGEWIEHVDIAYPRWEGDVRKGTDWIRGLPPDDPRCVEADRLRHAAWGMEEREIEGILGLPVYQKRPDED